MGLLKLEQAPRRDFLSTCVAEFGLANEKGNPLLDLVKLTLELTTLRVAHNTENNKMASSWPS